MKKILILLLTIAVLSASAQTDTTEIQTDSVEAQMIILSDFPDSFTTSGN